MTGVCGVDGPRAVRAARVTGWEAGRWRWEAIDAPTRLRERVAMVLMSRPRVENRLHPRLRFVWLLSAATACAAWLMMWTPPALAADRTPGIDVPGIGGKLHLELRPRVEFADIHGSDESLAWTLRTRLGYGTPVWQGLSAYVEMESVVVADDDNYFDGVSAPNGESLIADPEEIELNRAFLQFEREDWAGLKLVGGRQRIKLDDDRFVGNVGWRQNEQTFDAALMQTSLGVEGLSLTYAYLWEIQRIFGDDGGPGTRDFDSNTHLVRVSYDRYAQAKPVLFAYLMDFDNSPANSSNTYGFRVTGDVPVADELSAAYQLTYAHQTDAGDNPVDYDADYFLVDALMTYARAGGLGIGYEILGSDDGTARVVTPLATGHAFNGWADAFLDNGGPGGLRDLYVYLVPKLPWSLKGRLVYHWFEADEGGGTLGHEFDALLAKKLWEHVTVLAKTAYFDATSSTAPADRVRAWLQAEIVY